MKIFFSSIILILVNANILTSQTIINGVVLDTKTKEKIVFANIVYNNKKQGTTTGIDGKFKINSTEKISNLEISFLGYKTKNIEITPSTNTNNFQIELEQTAYNIDEVSVFPGINPAHRIMNKVIENRKINNPEKMQSFEYTSYNKMIFTFDLNLVDTANSLDTTKNSIKQDSSIIAIRKFQESQYLLMSESVSKRKFMQPDKSSEKVIASRISGLQNPSFTLLATQLQSLSFYSNYINILDKNYLSPISSGSTNKYFFLIEDTLLNENNDTIFIISFRPQKEKNFDGLKGVLNISTNKYAVQSVKAEPYEQKGMIDVKIQQNYIFIDNTQWFPNQLNTDLTFLNLNLSVNKKSDLKVFAIGKTYIKDIKLNPEFEKKTFNHISLEVEKDALNKDNTFWNEFREDTLNSKEIKTYEVIDSIGKSVNLDQQLETLTSLYTGKIPYKFINLDLTKLIGYNQYEGFTLGLGLETNQKVLKFANISGYFRYGFKDLAFKYGSQLNINISNTNEINLFVQYFNEVKESSGYEFYGKKGSILSATTSEYFRNYLISDMYKTEGYKLTLENRMLRYLKLEYSIKYSTDIVTNNYSFDKLISDGNIELTNKLNKYTNNEASIKAKYGFKEKFTKTQYGLISMGTDYPIFYFNLIFGLNNFDGNYTYSKYEAMVTKSFMIKNLGKTSITINGAYTNNNIPYIYLYNGHESYYSFTLESQNSFGTMRMNEFLSDEFVSVFLRHDFKSLLFKKEWFQPKFVIVTNLGYGKLKNTQAHNNISYKTMEKGYYESGLLINNIFKQSISSIGIGVFYRYGPYSFDKIGQNFAYKLSIYYSL